MFTIVGKPTKRVDTHKKVNGTAGFGVDVRLPDMLHASVEHCPVFGGTVVSFDGTKAKAIHGVKDVVPIMTVKDPKKPPVMTAVAVVADNTWTAFQGRQALEIKWDEGPGADANSADIRKSFEAVMDKPGVVSRKEGDADASKKDAATTVEAVYWAPYQAHSTMEPMNGTADVRADGVDLWVPTQFQTPSQLTGAGISGLPPDKVKVHTTYLGGGFGRRGWSDFVAEAAQLSKAIGKPVQVTWKREDDTQHDYYRPASLIKMSAALDSSGKPTALTARVACDSIMSWFFPGSITNGLDSSSVEGVSDIAYDIPNILVDYHLMAGPVPMGFWRSVGASQNGFFSESFVDEMAAAAKKDPYQFRRDLLAKKPRHLGVLNLAAEKAGWGTELPKGRYRGIAVLEAFSTYAAEVVEISIDKIERRQSASRDCRRRLRTRDQSRHGRSAGFGRHRLRHHCRPEYRNHHRQGPRRPSQFRHRSSAADERMSENRSPLRAQYRNADGTRRTGGSAHRPGHRQRHLRRHRQARPQAANQARRPDLAVLGSPIS